MNVKVKIEPLEKEIEINRVDLINALLEDVRPLEKQLKALIKDRIKWDDIEEAETQIEHLKDIQRLYNALKRYKYDLHIYYPEDFPDGGDLGLKSLFG